MDECSRVPSSGSAMGTAFPTKGSNELQRASDISNAEALSSVNACLSVIVCRVTEGSCPIPLNFQVKSKFTAKTNRLILVLWANLSLVTNKTASTCVWFSVWGKKISLWHFWQGQTALHSVTHNVHMRNEHVGIISTLLFPDCSCLCKECNKFLSSCRAWHTNPQNYHKQAEEEFLPYPLLSFKASPSDWLNKSLVWWQIIHSHCCSMPPCREQWVLSVQPFDSCFEEDAVSAASRIISHSSWGIRQSAQVGGQKQSWL